MSNPNEPGRECPTCAGTGGVLFLGSPPSGPQPGPCPTCQGTGKAGGQSDLAQLVCFECRLPIEAGYKYELTADGPRHWVADCFEALHHQVSTLTERVGELNEQLQAEFDDHKMLQRDMRRAKGRIERLEAVRVAVESRNKERQQCLICECPLHNPWPGDVPDYQMHAPGCVIADLEAFEALTDTGAEGQVVSSGVWKYTAEVVEPEGAEKGEGDAG